VGLPVEFTLKESQRIYTAQITLIAAAAEAESRLVPVTAEVDSDKKFWLRPGSFAQVKISLTPDKQFPMIPQTAARPSDRGFLAYVVDKNVVHEKVLQLGLHTDDGWVEVRDGLQVGDRIVTKGLEALAEGVRVQVVAPSGSGSAAPADTAHPQSAPQESASASGSAAASEAPRGKRGSSKAPSESPSGSSTR